MIGTTHCAGKNRRRLHVPTATTPAGPAQSSCKRCERSKAARGGAPFAAGRRPFRTRRWRPSSPPPAPRPGCPEANRDAAITEVAERVRARRSFAGSGAGQAFRLGPLRKPGKARSLHRARARGRQPWRQPMPWRPPGRRALPAKPAAHLERHDVDAVTLDYARAADQLEALGVDVSPKNLLRRAQALRVSVR